MNQSSRAPLCCMQVGTVSGEDYHFRFSGRIRDGKLFFRLKMEYEGDEEVCNSVATCDAVQDCSNFINHAFRDHGFSVIPGAVNMPSCAVDPSLLS